MKVKRVEGSRAETQENLYNPDNRFNKTAELRTEEEEREQGSLSGKDMRKTLKKAHRVVVFPLTGILGSFLLATILCLLIHLFLREKKVSKRILGYSKAFKKTH